MSEAAETTGPLSPISYSRLELFEKCPRAFWHAYVDRTPPDGFERIESWAGSLLHRVLEEALRQTLLKRVPDPVGIVGRFDDLWKTGIGPHVLITRDERDQSEYYQRARRSLKDYVDYAWPFLDAEPLHVEEPVEFHVSLPDGQRTRFTGIIDRVDRLKDGRLRIIDYKTGAWVPKFESDRDKFQLALYWHGLVQRYPDTMGGVLAWHYLQHKHQRLFDPDAALVGAATKWVTKRGGDIKERLARPGAARDAFPAKTSQLCRWCQFGYACDANPYKTEAPQPRNVGTAAPA